MNRRDAAIKAFQQAVGAERCAFDVMPGESACRSMLDHRYNRLAYWSGLYRDRSSVTVTLHEREKLWPMNVQELLEIAADFDNHAMQIIRGTLGPIRQ